MAQTNVTLSNTTETTLIAAAGVGLNNNIITLLISNTSSTPVRVDFRDATGGPVRLSIMAGGNLTIPYVFPDNIYIEQTTPNNNWTVQLSAAVTDVRIFAKWIVG